MILSGSINLDKINIYTFDSGWANKAFGKLIMSMKNLFDVLTFAPILSPVTILDMHL